MSTLSSHLSDVKRRIQMNHRVLLQKQQDSQLLNSLQLQVNEMQAALEDDKMKNKQTIQHN
jgi:hypothetical protein